MRKLTYIKTLLVLANQCVDMLNAWDSEYGSDAHHAARRAACATYRKLVKLPEPDLNATDARIARFLMTAFSAYACSLDDVGIQTWPLPKDMKGKEFIDSNMLPLGEDEGFGILKEPGPITRADAGISKRTTMALRRSIEEMRVKWKEYDESTSVLKCDSTLERVTERDDDGEPLDTVTLSCVLASKHEGPHITPQGEQFTPDPPKKQKKGGKKAGKPEAAASTPTF